MTSTLVADASNTIPRVSQTDSKQVLEIQLTQNLIPPSAEHQLLLGFNFGGIADDSIHQAAVNLQLRPLDRDNVFEAWWYKGEVRFSQIGPVRIAECQDYTVAIIQKEPTTPENIRAQTRQAYNDLLGAIGSTDHTKLIKVWNFFGDINNGKNDSEKYRQFSIGRAEAFRDHEIDDGIAPSGTAIGTQGDSGLTLIAVASNRKFFPVENPRQISAFHYPKKYGPSSPKFCRGGFVVSEKHKLYLISGTASVVGHQSNFPYDTKLQLKETVKNLNVLCDAISAENLEKTRFTLDTHSVLRVYIKSTENYSLIKQYLDEELKLDGTNIVYLHGTICREELMVEIDGITVI